MQPGPYDNGGRNDVIGRLYSFSPIFPTSGSKRGPVNRIDAALALPVSPEMVTGSVLGLGRVSGMAGAYPGMMVFKSGRSTGVTRGTVTSVANTVQVDNDGREYIFEGQIASSAKSDGGDSGSLVVNQYGRAVGLLFAGSDRVTYLNPIDLVFKHFGVSLY